MYDPEEAPNSGVASWLCHSGAAMRAQSPNAHGLSSVQADLREPVTTAAAHHIGVLPPPRHPELR